VVGAIDAVGVSKRYRLDRKREVTALEGVDLEVGQNEFVALVGPSGCGKSTFLYMVGGFLEVSEGRILVNGSPVRGPGPTAVSSFSILRCFWLTVSRNVLYGPEEWLVPIEELADRARTIALVGLAGFEMSSEAARGMKQRVALRALR
jgi:NitT/TauT family transport system ATP-binding protein